MLVADPALAQPFTLRAGVAATGATDGAGGTFTLRGTAGQPAAGRVSSGPYAVGQGFWYPATNLVTSVPPVDLTLTPIDPPPPVVIARGGTLRYRADFAIAANGPSQFQYWAEATLPNNQVRFLFGPVTVTGTPGTTVTRNLQQRVPRNVPLGAYVFRMKVGAYPGTVYDEDSFPVTVVAAEALAARTTGHPEARIASRTAGSPGDGVATWRAAAEAQAITRRAPADRTGRAVTLAAAELSVSAGVQADLPVAVARRITAAPDEWLAWDEDGTILEAGLVQDLRFAALDPTRNGPGDPEGASRAGGEGALAVSPARAAAHPSAFALAPASPNPFDGRTTLRFALPEAAHVRLTVYDLLGREMAVLVDGEREGGRHEVVFDGGALPAGVYLVRLTVADPARGAGRFVQTQRVTLLR